MFSPEVLVAFYVLLSAAFSSLLTSYFSYRKSRKKGVDDSFTSIIQANESFRMEIKKDLQIAKAEAENLRETLSQIEQKYRIALEQVSDLQHSVAEHQEKVIYLKESINKYKNEIAILTSVIDDYKTQLRKLGEE